MVRRQIIRGATLVALDGRRALRSTDLLIEDGIIAAIGGQHDADAEIQEVRGAVLPGMVQAHLHLSLSLQDVGFVPEQDPGVHHRLQRPAWEDALDDAGARTSAQAGLAWALSTGATTVADPSSGRHGPATLAAAEAVGSRIVLFVDARAADPYQALVVAKEEIAARQRSHRITVGLWAGDAERTPRRVLRAAAELAAREDVPMMVHLGLRTGDRRGIERLERAGALNSRLAVCHCTGKSLESARAQRRLAESGARVVVTPGFDVLTGAPPAPLAALLQAGISVGLGSECGAPRLGMDVFREARLAYRHLEGRIAEPAGAALEMGTRHGAAALGLATGSLEPGRAADLLVLALEPEVGDDHETFARRILDSAGPEHIRQIFVHGEPRIGELGTRRSPAPDLIEEVRGDLVDAVARRMGGRGSGVQGIGDVFRRRLRHLRGWHAS